MQESYTTVLRRKQQYHHQNECIKSTTKQKPNTLQLVSPHIAISSCNHILFKQFNHIIHHSFTAMITMHNHNTQQYYMYMEYTNITKESNHFSNNPHIK
jgi:hypothetical protein